MHGLIGGTQFPLLNCCRNSLQASFESCKRLACHGATNRALFLICQKIRGRGKSPTQPAKASAESSLAQLAKAMQIAAFAPPLFSNICLFFLAITNSHWGFSLGKVGCRHNLFLGLFRLFGLSVAASLIALGHFLSPRIDGFVFIDGPDRRSAGLGSWVLDGPARPSCGSFTTCRPSHPCRTCQNRWSAPVSRQSSLRS